MRGAVSVSDGPRINVESQVMEWIVPHGKWPQSFNSGSGSQTNNCCWNRSNDRRSDWIGGSWGAVKSWCNRGFYSSLLTDLLDWPQMHPVPLHWLQQHCPKSYWEPIVWELEQSSVIFNCPLASSQYPVWRCPLVTPTTLIPPCRGSRDSHMGTSKYTPTWKEVETVTWVPGNKSPHERK